MKWYAATVLAFFVLAELRSAQRGELPDDDDYDDENDDNHNFEQYIYQR